MSDMAAVKPARLCRFSIQDGRSERSRSEAELRQAQEPSAGKRMVAGREHTKYSVILLQVWVCDLRPLLSEFRDHAPNTEINIYTCYSYNLSLSLSISRSLSLSLSLYNNIYIYIYVYTLYE